MEHFERRWNTFLDMFCPLKWQRASIQRRREGATPYTTPLYVNADGAAYTTHLWTRFKFLLLCNHKELFVLREFVHRARISEQKAQKRKKNSLQSENVWQFHADATALDLKAYSHPPYLLTDGVGCWISCLLSHLLMVWRVRVKDMFMYLSQSHQFCTGREVHTVLMHAWL